MSSKNEIQKLNSTNQSNEVDKTCVVCFKIVDIFSIGECDHPVCYECSTRMRVLCKQNECPICRQINQKVIFTSEILLYRELEQKNRSGLYDKTFRISFTGQRALNAFYRLLEHRCNKCTKEPFETGVALKEHLRKEHELFYCDICMEHLKIFSFERRAYTREQLAQHRRKGDPDNKSHKGHPLCEYCDQRFLDRDELFRHLRKEHYFCHICEADGTNAFYNDHINLRQHFSKEHFLCDEGECKGIFSAFRTDIDFKAHKAQVHGQTSKHARTIDLQFNLIPRNRNRQDDAITNSNYNTQTVSSSHASEETFAAPRKLIDAQNEQEFPLLGNSSVVVRPTVMINTKPYGSSGLARTKENFPALGGGIAPLVPQPVSNVPPASALLFRTTANTKSTVKKTSATLTTNNNKAKQKSQVTNTAADFPALPGSANTSNNKKQHLDNDFIPPQPSFNLGAVSAKHRALVPSYESVSAASTVNQKIKTVQQAEVKNDNIKVNAPTINSNELFPALGPSSAPAPFQWVNASKQKQSIQSKVSKVAAAPVLPKPSIGLNLTIITSSKKDKRNKLKTNDTTIKANIKQSETKSDKKDTKENGINNGNGNGKENKSENTKNKQNKDANIKATKQNLNGVQMDIKNVSSYSDVTTQPRPPPGFTNKPNGKTVSVPPGFEPMMDCSKQCFSYISPTNALKRNQVLVSHFSKSLDSVALTEFRNISQMFREGTCNANSYYGHCESVLGDRFENIFPELLVLLPDIDKQQELLQVYMEKHENSDNTLINYIQVCNLCQQILKASDYNEHWQFHVEIEKDNKLNKNFPKLSTSGKK